MTKTKKIGAIIVACMIAFVLMTPHALAAGLEIEKTSPKNEETGVPLENLGVKVTFNQEVYNEANEKENAKACKLLDKDGKEVSTQVIFNEKNKDTVLILADTIDEDGKTVTADAESDYTLVIDKSFVAADGTALGKDAEITFTTLNPATSMKISMAMMLVMVVGMVIASSRSMKKQKEKEEGVKVKKEEKFNPYKVAKETGKPLKEVIAEEQKRREKEAAKAARKAKRMQEDEFEDDEIEEYMEPGHYKVKAVRTVAQGGSEYKTGKKAEAEKKKAIEEKIKASKKSKGGKNKKKKK